MSYKLLLNLVFSLVFGLSDTTDYSIVARSRLSRIIGLHWKTQIEWVTRQASNGSMELRNSQDDKRKEAGKIYVPNGS